MGNSISTLKATFLFSSTIVGAGILALPIAAEEAGFLPLAAMIVLLAVVSAFSGFYIAEAALADRQPLYLPALASKYLGKWGLIAMLLGISIYIYGALVGYLAAGGQIFSTFSHGAIPVWLGTLIYFIVGSLILHRGLVLVSQVNTYLMYAMLVVLGILIAMAMPKIQVPLLLRSSWSSVLDVFGVVLFAYLGHSVIPSIVFNLENKKRIGLVVSLGIALPCVLYLLWSMVVLGVVPAVSKSGHSLSTARAAGQPATIPLGFVIGGSVILLGNVFAAFSTMTSYIGFGVSLKDSYGDLAAGKRHLIPGLALTGLVVVPPLVIALLHPGAFLHILDIAGTFGGGLFVGILPVLIVLKARRGGPGGEFRTKGGAVAPYLVLLAYALGMLYTAAKLIGQ
ncbi:MAG: aromatic amino acid transport family protein [Chthoniobacterales bacterium]